MPKVSVVMPVCNSEKFLAASIESVLKQTFKEFEFIIIDDGSLDNTHAIIKKYAADDSRIRIINQEHSGIVVALNRGLIEARSQWIFRMDADDICFPDRFEAQIDVVEKEPSLVLIGSWCEQIDENGLEIKRNKYPAEHKDLINWLETGKGFFPHSSALYRRDMVIKAGRYRQRFCFAEDTDLWLRLSEYGKFACYKGALIKLRKHRENISNQHFRTQRLLSVAARICFFRRRQHLADLADLDDRKWQEFLKWLEKRLEEEEYFLITDAWWTFWNAWYSNVRVSRTRAVRSLIYELVRNKSSIKFLLARLKRVDISRKLAEESKKTF